MKIINLITIFMVVLVVVNGEMFSEDEYRESFVGWMKKYDRQYQVHEFNKAYNAYKVNLDYVTKWNQGESATILGMNMFADMTNEEFKHLYGTSTNGLMKPKTSLASFKQTPNIKLPKSVDWRKSGVVSPVTDMNDMCPANYALASVGAAESVLAISRNNTLIELSVQNIIDCSKPQGNQGCQGSINSSFVYMVTKGIESAADYPLTGKVGKCQFQPSKSQASFSSYTDVTSGSEEDLADAVASIGPVAVYYDASGPFQLYSSGIYYNKHCSSTNVDTTLLVVGYGSIGSQNYWIVKNWWGTSWGIQGYAQVAKDMDNNCGIASYASYITVNDRSN